MYISDISGANTQSRQKSEPVRSTEVAEQEAIPVEYTVSEPEPAPAALQTTAPAAYSEAPDAAVQSPRAFRVDDIKQAEYSKSPLRIARNYAIIALICLVIGIVYEIFSHGVWSVFMIGAFAIPLILGVIPNLVIGFGNLKTPDMASETLYACGIATLTLGSMLKGALDIFGTTNTLLDYYWMVGGAFTLLGIIFYFAQRKPSAATTAE